MMTFTDNSDTFIVGLERYGRRLTKEASKTLEEEARQLVDTPYPPASSPGQPPHRRTGVGQASIQAIEPVKTGRLQHRGGLVLRAEGFYMGLLDQGTSRILPRPWIGRLGPGGGLFERSKRRITRAMKTLGRVFFRR